MDRPSDEHIEAWYPRLFRTALRMTGNAHDAADLTQEAFCKALNGWNGFDGKAMVTTWLHRILVNCVRDWGRRQAHRPESLLDEWALVPQRNSTTETSDRGVQLDRVRQAIEKLPAKLRLAFISTVIDGYSYQETADLLSLSVGTIASRVHAARRQLRAAISPLDEEKNYD